MTGQDTALFNDSLERCTVKPGFMDRFYALFLASSPEVAERFSRTDFRKQKHVLKASLYMMMFAAEGKAEGQAHLQRLAKLHSRTELDIKPHFYELWLDCLLQAVREYDRRFTPETERVWRRMMGSGIEFMKSRY